MREVEDPTVRRAVMLSIETDDTSLARAWIEAEGGGHENTKFVRASDGSVRRFEDGSGIWSVLDDTEARRRLSSFLCEVADAKLEGAEEKLREGEIKERDLASAKALRNNLRSQTRFKAVWQTAMVHIDAVEIDMFDADPELLGTPGGVIDLRIGGIRPATATDMVSQLTAVTPSSPGASPTRWTKFLTQVFDGHPEYFEFIQRLLGSALVGNVSPQKFIVFYGRGANGKSVLRDVFGYLAGSYSVTASAKVFMQSYGDRHPTEIASLAGRRVIMASEVPAGRNWNDTLLKDLTGGEPMNARRMHKDEFTFTPRGTLLFTANTLPSFIGAQQAMLRRVVLIEFKREFTEDEQDPNLADDLIAEEGPAILRWAIDGAQRYFADGGGVKGLSIPQSISRATRDYFDDEDIVLQYLMYAQNSASSSCEWSTGAFNSCGCILYDFNLWGARNGHKPWSVRTLSKAIRENSERYGLSETRTNAARGFTIDRRISEKISPATGSVIDAAQSATLKRLRVLKRA